MSPENKADYYLHIFNNDVKQSIKMCNRMISTTFLQEDIKYYKQIKQILKTKL